ncbi:MAG: glycosyltransferase family 39 protein, partial [Ferruginibacter sp.]|nr:glycosyltransferase family 39 protein [Ferruginibacter sp.]
MLLSCWFAINLLQAIFTEINADEAYYVLYGQNLDWGYFDHPPSVGVMTHLSALFFKHNLGARFFTVLLQPLTLFITWKLIPESEAKKNKIIYFFVIAASLVMFSAYGFITTPDVPLLFFTAAFLYTYKNFIKKNNMLSALLLSLTMAGLIYSKYQGFILVGLVVLSNLKLLVNFRFWLAGIIALLMVSPHFWWQYTHHFPSFRYHLIDRSEGFKWEYVFEYLPNQIAVFNPFTFGAIVYLMIKKKPKDAFEKSLHFIIIGFIALFGLTTFRGHAEPHWTVAASIPMIILLFKATIDNGKIFRYVKRYVTASLVLVMIARVLLVSNLLPERIGFTGKEKKMKAIQEIAGNCPVVFSGSFQNPSLYTFFTGNESTVISSLNSRQTQFDIWRKDALMGDKKVFVMVGVKGKSQKYKSGDQEIEGFFTNNLQTANQLEIVYSLSQNKFSAGDTVNVSVNLINHSQEPFQMNHPEFPAEINAVFLSGKKIDLQKVKLNEPVINIDPKANINRNIRFTIPPLSNGKHVFGLSVSTLFGPAIN